VRITDLKIDAFGVWRAAKLEDLPAGITVLYGRNEAGKTTLLEFLRGMLYGFASEPRRRYLDLDPPPKRLGGSLLVGGSSEGELLISRRVSAGDRSEEVTITAADGTVGGEALLGSVLRDVDEATFRNVFAFGLRELQHLGALSDTQAATWLYRITSGLERVSLLDVQRNLAERRARLLGTGQTPGRLLELLAERKRLRSEIEPLARQNREWVALCEQRDNLQRQLAGIEEDNKSLRQTITVLEAARAVADHWQRRARLRMQEEQLAAGLDIGEEDLARLDRLTQRLAERQAHRDRLRAERRRLRRERDAIRVNERLWRAAARVEALGEQESWLASLEQQAARLEEEVSELELKWEEHQQKLGLSDRDSWQHSGEISPQWEARLPPKAKELRRLHAQLTETEQEANRNLEAAARLESEIAAGLAGSGERELQPALEAAGSRVATLRRRIAMDERLEQLELHRDELESQITESLDRQLMPVWLLASLGGIFVLAAILLVISFWLSSNTAGTLGLLLTVVGVTGALSKFFMERSAAQRHEACRRQLELLERQKESTEQERRDLDEQLPRGGRPLAVRLKDAEAEVARLENLLPLDTQRQSAVRDASAAEARLEHLREEQVAARKAWRRTLREVGLPEDLSPKQARYFAGRSEDVTQLKGRLDARREELERHRREIDRIAQRVRSLADEAGCAAEEGESTGDAICRMVADLRKEEAAVRQRDALGRELREARRKESRLARRIVRMRRRRQTMLEEAGCRSDAEFRAKAEQLARLRELRAELQSVSQEISAALKGAVTEEQVAPWFSSEAETDIAAEHERLRAKLAEHDEHLRRGYEQRGELKQQIAALAEDTRLGACRLHLASVEGKIRRAAFEWQSAATAELLLEAVRKRFERERQPETLIEASGYLEALTEGRYRRVWTPLGEDVLRVDDASGKAWAVEDLSRGTREQLLLALRLALVSLFARRGTVLPVIMDDVLVNFDERRAEAAARVLCDFAAAGRQVLLFTCHEHVWRMFAQLEVEVRRLPSKRREGVVIERIEAPAALQTPAPVRAETAPERDATESGPAVPDEEEAEDSDHLWEELAEEESDVEAPLAVEDDEDEYEWEYVYEEVDDYEEPAESEGDCELDDEQYIKRPADPEQPPALPKARSPQPRSAQVKAEERPRRPSGTHGWDVEFEDEWNESSDRWNDDQRAA